MKRLISLLLAFIILFTSSVCYAEDPPVTLPDVPDAVLTPMNKDEKAPYQGVLLSPEAIANIIADYKAFEEKLRIELERANGEAEAQKKFAVDELKATCEADKKVLKSQIDSDKREIKLLVDRQKELEKESKSVVVWTLVGAGAGALVAALGFYGVSRLTD